MVRVDGERVLQGGRLVKSACYNRTQGELVRARWHGISAVVAKKKSRNALVSAASA